MNNEAQDLSIEDSIISKYMEDVLEDNAPKNVHQFCKKNDFNDKDFYKYFASLERLQQQIWVKFLDNTIHTLEADTAYHEYNDTNKLIAFYFTFFEVLTLNRSYVTTVLPNDVQALKNLKQLTALRPALKSFLDHALTNTNMGFINEQLATFTKPLLKETHWIQFLFVLHFWLNDDSKGFEKTDILIEKLVNTSQELKDAKPLESLLDLGKFLWKEKSNR
jgi:hypothetical protein